MLQELSTQCPICEAKVGNVKNHVRMSSDEAHGKQGQYPDGFEADSTRTGRPRSSSDLDPEEETTALEVGLEDDGDQEESSEEALESLELGDDPEAASDYHCGDCEDRLEYHQEECQCGGNPMWRVA